MIKESVQILTDPLMQRQRYLEVLEAEKRASNMVVSGVPEGNFTVREDTAQTDMEKIQMILTKIGKPEIEVISADSVGKMQGPQWKRMIKVRLAHADYRKIILGEKPRP